LASYEYPNVFWELRWNLLYMVHMNWTDFRSICCVTQEALGERAAERPLSATAIEIRSF
jgi:hypothetical protein